MADRAPRGPRAVAGLLLVALVLVLGATGGAAAQGLGLPRITIDATDPKSGTAEFKAAAIRVEKLAREPAPA